MECNKEEAIRAMEIAEKKMHEGDFEAAKRIALKAEKLFPDLENLSQLLTVCDVHCSAKNKLNGTEMDWYEILQVERFSNKSVILKQFRTLALSLHPDKNQLPGAESAFKMIEEARRVLTDATKRHLYDMKFGGLVKNAASTSAVPHPVHFTNPHVAPKFCSVPTSSINPQPQQPTFWTWCSSCNMRYQYYKELQNKTLLCQSCKQTFIAYDLGIHTTMSGFFTSQSLNQKGQNQAPPKSEQSRMGDTTKFPEVSGQQEGPNVFVKVEPWKGATSLVTPASLKRKGSKALTSDKTKREQKSEDESNVKLGRGGAHRSKVNAGSSAKHSAANGVYQLRRSSKYDNHISNQEDIVEIDIDEMHDNDGNSEGDESDSNAEELEPKKFESPDPEFNSFDEDKTEESFAVNQLWAIYDSTDGMPRFYARIKKVLSPGFKVSITWLEPNSDIKDEQRWCDNDLPVACGKFKNGETEEATDRLMFSHQMRCLSGLRKGTYLVYPKKGETWALFRDWDIKWSLEPEKHSPPYKYEFVEILSDFIDGVGIRIAHLSKVKGFVSLFLPVFEVDPIYIPPRELYRFSHRIPSFRMTGKEREGVPAGSFELDPASLSCDPSYFNDLSDAKSHTESLKAKANDSISMSATSSDVKPQKDFKNVSMSKENENGQENEPLTRSTSTGKNYGMCNSNNVDAEKFTNENCSSFPMGISTSYQAGESVKDPRKHVNSELVLGLPSRSLRSSGKRIGLVNLNVRQSISEYTEKHTTVVNRKHGQLKASSGPSVDKQHIHAKDDDAIDVKKQRASLKRKVVEVEAYDFEKDRAEDKYQRGQIWALWSAEDGLPKKYGQIKKIETLPNFRLHVAMLEPYVPPKEKARPVSCGVFNITSQQKVLPRSRFSHRVDAFPLGKNKIRIHPTKGDIWAIYRTSSGKSTHSGSEDCSMVEVLEATNKGVKVRVLLRINNNEPFYKASSTTQASKASVKDIPLTEFSKFSHQCLAIQHSGEDSHLHGIWELDVKSIPGTLVILD